MPLTGVNINNVSMDYFLRGVDAAKPQGVQPSQVPQEGANAQIDQKQQAVGKMVSQLDVLLMKAAMASTKGLDGKPPRSARTTNTTSRRRRARPSRRLSRRSRTFPRFSDRSARS